MFELVIFASLIGVGCWGFNKWLASQERQQFMQRLEARQRDTGQIIDVTEAKQLYALSQPPKPVKAVGVNKWVVIALCVLYIVFPLDILPDFIPVLGWGDDLAAAVIALRQFFK